MGLENLQFFLGGAVITFLVSTAAWVIGVTLGLLIALARTKRLPGIAPLLALYVSFIRSLPLPLLVMLFYFGLPVAGIDLDPFVAGIIALALNSSTFNSEIWRSAILNFPPEQLDAARSIGMTAKQAFWRITFPQIWRESIPTLTNEMTFLVKASPAIGVIGIDDLTRRAGKLAASNYEPLPTIMTGMLMYALVLLAISLTSRMVDRHFQRKFELV